MCVCECVVVKCVWGGGGGEIGIYAHISENYLFSPHSLLPLPLLPLPLLPLSFLPLPLLPLPFLLGIDVEEMKGVEEAAMLEDAQRLKNDSSLTLPISVGGATLLHIAAAKNYLRVLK